VGHQNVAAKSQQNNQVGKDLFMVRLVKNFEESDFGSSKEGISNQGWRLVWWDLPEPAQKKAVLRMAMDTEIETENIATYMELMKYR
jgi:hypothetical protein